MTQERISDEELAAQVAELKRIGWTRFAESIIELQAAREALEEIVGGNLRRALDANRSSSPHPIRTHRPRGGTVKYRQWKKRARALAAEYERARSETPVPLLNYAIRLDGRPQRLRFVNCRFTSSANLGKP